MADAVALLIIILFPMGLLLAVTCIAMILLDDQIDK